MERESLEQTRKCVVLIPIYKEKLSDDEAACVKRYEEILRQKTAFLAPAGMDQSWYRNHFPKIDYFEFPAKYFKSTKTYNRLMLNPEFYRKFSSYEFMLIAQTDAVIWGKEDRLSEFMEFNYDYIGAPWIPERRIWEFTFAVQKKFPWIRIKCCKKAGCGITMGNGGFSLRKISKCIELTEEFSWRKIYWFWKRNEDIFFGVFGRENRCGFRLADVATGKRFAREYDLRECVINGDIPYAVHGWNKDFKDFEEMKRFLEEQKVWEPNQ